MYLYILNYVTIFNHTSNYIKKKHKKKILLIFFQKYQIKKNTSINFSNSRAQHASTQTNSNVDMLGPVYYQPMYQWAWHHTWPILYGLKRCQISFVKNKKSNLQSREYWKYENTNKQIYLLNPCLFK
jgi:hypothetical protein